MPQASERARAGPRLLEQVAVAVVFVQQALRLVHRALDGLLRTDEGAYYLTSDGQVYTGWFIADGALYYADGTWAQKLLVPGTVKAP